MCPYLSMLIMLIDWRGPKLATRGRSPDPAGLGRGVREGVLTLTLDRPAQRNALDRQSVETLGRQVGVARTDPTIRVVVVCGPGSVFSA